MNHQKDIGTALVDTAAQHGLVGRNTLGQHDSYLKSKFGLQVQWTHESGGSVRGVCGAEESTQVAYVPIGIGGRSGVLRVQVVPGDIPFLLPAYFLTDLEAVIDMKHAMIMYMKLGVKQYMKRLSTGHVAVSIVEFGRGFNVPSNLAVQRSQAWCTETVPNWSQVAPSYAHVNSTAMAPVAALVAAALTWDFLRNWQIMMEVVRTPQLRSARQLQMRRERLEREVHALHQEEQKVLAQAASSTSSMATSSMGQMNVARREDRVRPLACIMGKGKYLVPALEPSPQCAHKQVTHGANRMMSYQRCLDCQQEQKMPLTPLQDLHHWNTNLAFLKEDFFKKLCNQELTKRGLGAKAKTTAVKSRPKTKATVKTEIKEEENEFEQQAVILDEQDAWMTSMETLDHPAHQQPCSYCQPGQVTLHRMQMTNQLVWKCNNPRCDLFYAETMHQMEEARGVFLCPQCQAEEMVPISTTQNPEETEVQCLGGDCNMTMYLFEMAMVYGRMGMFNTDRLIK